LCAAYELEQLGHETVVLEAHPSRVGGRVFTRRFADGQYGELGAMRIPQHHDLTRHYVSLFGLSVRTFVQSNPEALLRERPPRED
jgi:monoamine oxidase